MILNAQSLEAIMPDATQLESDEPEMESSLHYSQLLLLVSCLEWYWRDTSNYFIGANLTIYFSRQQLKNKEFRGPDFFLIKNTEKKPRSSWVVWEEDGKYPNLIIELLSKDTASVDRNLKKELYQDRFRTPEYFWFYPQTLEFAGFRLVGDKYQPIPVDEEGKRWSEQLGLYLGVYQEQLRYFTAEGQLVARPEEDALQAIAEAQQAQSLAQLERLRAEKLAAKLRSLGINPDTD